MYDLLNVIFYTKIFYYKPSLKTKFFILFFIYTMMVVRNFFFII